jgi:hypothetical protein
MENEPVLAGETDNTVLELLDRVLNTGVVLVGDVTITVADIELLYLRLQLMLSSAETARRAGWLAAGPHFDRRHSIPKHAKGPGAEQVLQ